MGQIITKVRQILKIQNLPHFFCYNGYGFKKKRKQICRQIQKDGKVGLYGRRKREGHGKREIYKEKTKKNMEDFSSGRSNPLSHLCRSGRRIFLSENAGREKLEDRSACSSVGGSGGRK